MKIRSIKEVKPKTVYAVQTSTNTYIADGLAHHNCAGCNTFNNGEQYRYGVALDLKYGPGTANKLAKACRQEFKLTNEFLEEIIHDAQEAIRFYENIAVDTQG